METFSAYKQLYDIVCGSQNSVCSIISHSFSARHILEGGGGGVETDNGSAAILSLQTVDIQLTAAPPPVHQMRNFSRAEFFRLHF